MSTEQVKCTECNCNVQHGGFYGYCIQCGARLRGEAAQCATCGGSGFIDHNLGAGIGRITEDEFCPECEGDTKRTKAAQGEQQAVAWHIQQQTGATSVVLGSALSSADIETLESGEAIVRTLVFGHQAVSRSAVLSLIERWRPHGRVPLCELEAALSAAPAAPAPVAGAAVAALSGKYGNVLAPFVCLMERELHANAGKGDRPGWLAMSADTALLEIYYHVAKLQKAVRKEGGDLIAEHAADVANMAMMLLDVCGGIEASSLAQDRASQPLPSPVPGDQVADIVARWMDKDLSADVAMLVIKRHLDHCYMQPANDYNRGWVAGANSVTERAAELVEAAERASQAGAAGVPEGWRLVPVEPTDAMIDAAADVDPERESVWAAYLAAAPTPAAEGEVRNAG